MNVRNSYSANYFSLEDIIASQIRVPCKTLVDIHNFGFLDPSLNSDKLPKGHELELPLWGAQSLITKKNHNITIDVPKKYKEAYREVLKADATVVDLNKLGPHFYQSGLHLSSLQNSDAKQIAEILPDVLQRRLLSMADSYSYTTEFHSADAASSGRSGTLMKEIHMDVLEQRIYNDARRGADDIQKWLENKF